jgi:hypothetical protein
VHADPDLSANTFKLGFALRQGAGADGFIPLKLASRITDDCPR